MACVADSSPHDGLRALESRLRREAQEREQCIKAELKAELNAELELEQDRRFLAERRLADLATELRHLSADFEAEGRDDPQLMEEMHLMAAPASNQKGEDGQPAPEKSSSRSQLLNESGCYKSLELMKEDKLEGLEFDYKDLPQDMWGVAIMTLTRDTAELRSGHEICAHLVRFTYAMSMVILNLALQLSILHWVYKYVVGESIFNIQGNYAKFHRDVFDGHGRFKEKAWIDWDGPRDDLCSAVLTKKLFLGAVLFLWMGRMMGEFKSIVRLTQDLNALPSVPAGASVADTVLERNDQIEIIGMTCCSRFIIYLIVILPKLAINIILAGIGLQWLTSTENFADLILNALALEFVIGIDEQILEFFLPARCTTSLLSTKFAYPSKGRQKPEQELAAMVWDYTRNIMYFVATVGLTVAYLNYAQQVLPYHTFDIKEHCNLWFLNRFTPKCSMFQDGCFPFGDAKSPYNYALLTPAAEHGLCKANPSACVGEI